MTSPSELDHVDTLEFGSGGTLAQRLSPGSVRRFEFGRSPIGRRGYNEADVEHFRVRVVHEVVQSTAERAALRQELQRQREEVQRLRDYFRRNRVDVDAVGGQAAPAAQQQPATQVNVNIATVQAVNVMSQAQQAADQHIAQAEDYARRLVANARLQYEEILHRAHDQAQAAAAEAGRVAEEQQQHAPHEDPTEMQYLQSRLAYMRTFAQVTQVQLRSILDALRTELDQLTELPAAPGVSAASAVSAAPAGRTVDVRHPQYQR